MADQVSFSRRHGLADPPVGTLVREHAPVGVRLALIKGAIEFIVDGYEFRNLVCAVLQVLPKSPDTSLDGWQEAKSLVYECEWFKVYDLIERVYNFGPAQRLYHTQAREKFASDINQAFLGESIGWQLVDGKIVTRGDEAFEGTLKTAVTVLEEDKKPTAAGHLRSAISALSVRPRADTSGAVTHATSAVECVLGEITGKPMTLSAYLNKYPNLFHQSLRKGLDGVYGYASDVARHGKENTEPAREEAEFVVAVCAAVCTLLLSRKHPK